MIEKIDHKGIEHIYMFFGHGTIEVLTGAPEDIDYENNPTDVIFNSVDVPQKIGLVSENNYNCTTELKSPVVMRFSKPESVDVVIRALEKVKASLS